MDRIHDLKRLGNTFWKPCNPPHSLQSIRKNNIPCCDSATAHEKHLSWSLTWQICSWHLLSSLRLLCWHTKLSFTVKSEW